MDKTFIRKTFLAFGLLGTILTSCTRETEDVQVRNDEVRMVANVNREDIISTRTSHQEIDGNISTTWAEGDKLLVTNVNGGKLGILELVGGVGEKKGEFEGSLYGLTDGTANLNYFYLGSTVTDLASFDGNVSLATQRGTLANLSDCDIYSSTASVTIENGVSFVEEIGLKRNFLFAHFKLNMPTGVSITSENITISGTNLKNSAKFGFKDADYTAEEGTIITGSSNGDFYIMLIPGENIGLEFSVTVGGDEYIGSLKAVNFKANTFIRNGANEGIPVAMEAVDKFDWGAYISTTIKDAATLEQWADSHDAVGANGKSYFVLGTESPAVDLTSAVTDFNKHNDTKWNETNDPSKEGYHMATYAEWEGLRWISQNAGYGSTYLTLNDTHYYIKTNSKGSNKIKIVFQQCNDLGEKIGKEQTIEFGEGKSISVQFESTSPWAAKSIREQNYARYWVAYYKCAYVDLSYNVGLTIPNVTSGSSKGTDWYGMRIRSIRDK